MKDLDELVPKAIENTREAGAVLICLCLISTCWAWGPVAMFMWTLWSALNGILHFLFLLVYYPIYLYRARSKRKGDED